METIFAQVIADLWKVAPEDVVVSLADTASIAIGFGTMASRSTVTASAAMHHASEPAARKSVCDRRPYPRMRARPISNCAIRRGRRRRRARRDVTPRPDGAGGAPRLGATSRPPGVDAGLEETYYWQPPTVTWSYAVHAAIVEVDAETGRVRLDDYAVAHDCGNVVNPMLVEGQIMGGAVQGLGGILCEAIAYDANGQLLSGSLMDYALPIAGDIPAIKIVHQHSPSPLNPLGVKGVGEGGAVAPPAAVANAVCDALAAFGVEINATPIRPENLVSAMRQSGSP